MKAVYFTKEVLGGSKLKVKVVINNHYKTGQPFSISLSYYWNDEYTHAWECLDYAQVNKNNPNLDLEVWAIQKGIDKLWDKKNKYGNKKYIMNLN